MGDLEKITGLELSLNAQGMIEYSKDEDGNNLIQGSNNSKDARDMLIHSIDDKKNTVNVASNPSGEKSFAYGNDMQIGEKQIQSFINGTSSDLNRSTQRFGTTFLHDLAHTPSGGGLGDSYVFGTTGAVENNMNIIRAQMGPTWVQRTSYMSKVITGMNGGEFIPMSKSSLNLMKSGFPPQSSYIKLQ